jgi:lipopolysaccharide heptosyltransferase II
LPVLRLIKQHLPKSEIYWWIDRRLAPLLEGDPDLTRVIPFERQRWWRPKNWREVWHKVRWIRDQSFDWVVDLQSLMRSGVLAWLANGKFAIGLDEPREGARGFYDIIVRRPPLPYHAVEWNLAVLPLLGVPVHGRFDWLPSRPEVAADVRRKWPVAGKRWVALQPGARWLNKRWPVEHFAELVRGLAAWNREIHFAVLGSGDDASLTKTIVEAAPERALDLAGRVSLPELIEWLRLSELLVTNDTGPMHLAAAINKPVVAMFGPTEPRKTGPYGQVDHALQLELPCVPCMKSRCRWHEPMECLRGLRPERVLAAVQERLDVG